MYESGESLRTIADILKINYHSVHNWSEKGEWIKGSLSTQIAQSTEKGILALAEEIGLTKRHSMEKIVEFQDATRVIWVKDKPGTSDEPERYTIDAPDYAVQMRGNQQALDVLNLVNKGEITANVAIPILIQNPEGNNLIQLGIKNVNG